ncbi:MAG: ATP-binding protein [Candidatus Zixiibacteriota bacterium]
MPIVLGAVCLIGFFCVFMLGLSESRRRQVERDLRRSEERFSQVASSTGDWIWEADSQGRYLYSSSAVADILGYTPEEILGKHFYDLFHPEDKETLKTRVFGVFQRREPLVKLINRNLHKDGHSVILETSGLPLIAENGGLLGYRGADRDITERVRAEEALNEYSKRLQEMVEERKHAGEQLGKEMTAVATVVNDMLRGEMDDAQTEKRVLEACLTATDSVYGQIGKINEHGKYDTTTYSSQTLEDCAFPEALAWEVSTGMTIRGIWGWPMLKGEPLLCNHLEAHPDRVGLPKGHVPLQCFLGVPLKREGKVVGMVAVANKPRGYSEEDRDALIRLASVMSVSRQHQLALTAAKRTSAELEQLVAERTAELLRANEEMQSFIYSISHDLRMPLVAVQGFTNLLKEEYGDDLKGEAEHYLSAIVQSTGKMSDLIEDLLQLSRVGRMDTEPEEVALESLVDAITTELKVKTPKRKLNFRIKEPLPETYCNRKRLYQVFSNLLGNAVKFTRNLPEAKIEVGVRKQGSKREFYVRDNGPGIDPQYHEEIFKVFRRLHGSAYEGSGMGLTFAKKIVESWGGNLRLQSKPGKGATFYFTVPEAQKSSTAKSERMSSDSSA